MHERGEHHKCEIAVFVADMGAEQFREGYQEQRVLNEEERTATLS
jgi:hypothetical protein